MAEEDTKTDPAPKGFEPAIGDLVSLKGGTWNMTVVGQGKNGVRCAWHDRNGVPQSGEYPAGALIKTG
jgi:uncharacterized protein YodC (DUF2158 family)